jgi:Ca2+/Na+ antiporter
MNIYLYLLAGRLCRWFVVMLLLLLLLLMLCFMMFSSRASKKKRARREVEVFFQLWSFLLTPQNFRGEVLGVSEWGGIKKKEREWLLISQTSETAANKFGFRGAKY